MLIQKRNIELAAIGTEAATATAFETKFFFFYIILWHI